MAWGDNTKDTNNKGPWAKKPDPKQGASKPADNKPAGGKPSFGGFGQGGAGQNNNDKIFDFGKFMKKQTAGGSAGASHDFSINSKGIIVIFLLALLCWFLTGFYIVDASEEGIILRFGKYHRTANQGLRYHLPSPIEKLYIVRKTMINSIQIGYRTTQGATQNARTFQGPGKSRQNATEKNSSVESKQLKESLMITGDTNIADVSFTVQWRIKDSFNYLFKVANPIETMQDTIKAVSESAMREVIGRTNFAEAMTTKRSQIENDVQTIIQNVLNSYDAGIEIYTVNLNDVQNPELVMPAFLDVETAKQDKETAINKAKAYENEAIPRARGDAQKIVQGAEAYKQQVIAVASGEAQRFAEVYNEYLKAKDVTKKRIYLETMQQIMAGTDKIILGEGVGKNAAPYLSLQDMKKNRQEKPENSIPTVQPEQNQNSN